MTSDICHTCYRMRDVEPGPDGQPICATCEFRGWDRSDDADDPSDYVQDGPQ